MILAIKVDWRYLSSEDQGFLTSDCVLYSIPLGVILSCAVIYLNSKDTVKKAQDL